MLLGEKPPPGHQGGCRSLGVSAESSQEAILEISLSKFQNDDLFWACDKTQLVASESETYGGSSFWAIPGTQGRPESTALM